MDAAQTGIAVRQPDRAERSSRFVVARLTARRAARSGLLWGYIFGASMASSALSYSATYKSAAQRAHLAATFASNAGLSALVGPGKDLQTVAGFTAWKTFLGVAVVAGVWGLLTGTRLLRGEEEAGRAELLLTGQTTLRGSAAQSLAGLGAGFAVLLIVTSVVCAVVGRMPNVGFTVSSSAYFGLAMVAPAAIFLAAGALTSQLASTRHQASTIAAVALGVSYAVRMVADSSTGLAWLRWVSPIGWVEELQPLTAPRPWALVPIAALVIVLCAATLALAARRDLGAATLHDRAVVAPHTTLLSRPFGLATRLARGSLIAWGVAIAATGFLLGGIAKSGGQVMSGSASISKGLARLGAPGGGTSAYLGVCFLMTAILVLLVGAGQAAATRREESDGHTETLLVRPVSRWAWLSGRTGLAALALLAAGVLTGITTWLGTAADHAGIGLGQLLSAGLNTVAPALCLLGIGVLAFGVRPRATAAVVYAVLGWSLLIDLVGVSGAESHWVLDTSLFHQMAAAPAVAPNWGVNGVLVAIAVAAAAIGALAFARRDLQGA
ncbi:MAG TPA: hypothetical protein VHA57_09015 [Actinomycetota bacterium]|nr:hypothetical protein [Actinomycetota bacterium]